MPISYDSLFVPATGLSTISLDTMNVDSATITDSLVVEGVAQFTQFSTGILQSSASGIISSDWDVSIPATGLGITGLSGQAGVLVSNCQGVAVESGNVRVFGGNTTFVEVSRDDIAYKTTRFYSDGLYPRLTHCNIDGTLGSSAYNFTVKNFANSVIQTNLRVTSVSQPSKPLSVDSSYKVISGNILMTDVSGLPEELANIQSNIDNQFVEKSGDTMTGTLEVLGASINVKSNPTAPSFGGYIQLTPNVSGVNKIYTDGTIPLSIDGQLSSVPLVLQNFAYVSSTQPLLVDSVRSIGTTLNVGSTSLTQTLNVGVGSQLTTINIGTGALVEQDTINIGSDTSIINMYGNTHYVQITNYAVSDKDIQLNANAVGSGTARGAGLLIRDAGVNGKGSFVVNSTGTGWSMTAPEATPTIQFNNNNFTLNGFLKAVLNSPVVGYEVQPVAISTSDLPAVVAFQNQINGFYPEQYFNNFYGNSYIKVESNRLTVLNTSNTNFIINGDLLLGQSNDFIVDNFVKANIRMPIDVGSNPITSSYTPSASTDLTNKAYVDTKASLSGAIFTGAILVQYGGKYIQTTNNTIYTDSSAPFTINGQGTSGNIVVVGYGNAVVEGNLFNVGYSTRTSHLYTSQMSGLSGLNLINGLFRFVDDVQLHGNLHFAGGDSIYGDITNNINIFSNVNLSGNIISSSFTPTSSSHLTNKSYVDSQISSSGSLKVSKSGDTMSGNLLMGSNKITSSYVPVDVYDLVNKTFVDDTISSFKSSNETIVGDWIFNNTKTTFQGRIYQRSGTYQVALIQGASSPTLPDSGTYPNGLTMGNDGSYAWIQSWNSRPLSINRLGNTVEYGSSGTGVGVNLYGGAMTIYNAANTSEYFQVGYKYSYGGANNIFVDGQGQNYFYSVQNFANYYVGAAWQISSDKRLKNSIQDIETDEAIEVIEALNPVEFKYNGNDTDTYSGFIAQDVQRVNPDFVKGTDDRLALDYNSIFVYQTKVIQHLLKEVASLKNALRFLEKSETKNGDKRE